MGKYMFVGAIAVVAIITLVALAVFLGYIDLGIDLFSSGSDDSDTLNIVNSVTDLGYTNREIHQAICLLTNKTPPFTQHNVFIEGLHMKMWGVDDVTAYHILTEYEDEYDDDDYTSYSTVVSRGIGWTAYTEIWYNGVGNGRAITVGDGSVIHGMYGYDTVILSSYGPITDYYDYVSFMSSY